MKTEKEKAAAGLLYNPNHDEELLMELRSSNAILFEYNHLPPGREDEGERLLRGLLGKMGKHVTFLPPFHCDYGYNIEVGDHFFANVNLVILDGAKVTIGDHVFIAPNVGIYTAGHPFDVEQRNEGLEYAYPISIGSNVWIGAQTCILPGVTIGDNSVIGAGSVVTKDIPPHSLAYGNPCRVIRQI